MNIGFVYILLNPAFPKQLKIGRTDRDSQKRARELSRQTGVPLDFIVIYEEVVSDARQVEGLVHEALDGYRVSKMKEFFVLPPKEAIRVLQEVASRFPVARSLPRLVADLLPHFVTTFASYMDPRVVGIRFVQLPGAYYLEVDRRTTANGGVTTSVAAVPLLGLEAPDAPTLVALGANEAHLRACDPYTWINISDVFPPDAVQRILEEWHAPGGGLEQFEQSKF